MQTTNAVITIYGPTAAGKTALSLALCDKLSFPSTMVPLMFSCYRRIMRALVW